MKVWSVIGLLFTAAIIATIPISPQVRPRGVELSLDQAQAITYGRHRRVTRVPTATATTVFLSTTVLPSRSAVAAANGTLGSFGGDEVCSLPKIPHPFPGVSPRTGAHPVENNDQRHRRTHRAQSRLRRLGAEFRR